MDRESEARVDAHQLWLRVRCLDPGNSDAQGGIARTFPVAIHRPPVTVVEGAAPKLHSWVSDPWEELGQGLIVYVEPPPPQLAKREPLSDALEASEPDPELSAATEPHPEPEVLLEPEPEIDRALLAAERAAELADLEEQLVEAAEALRMARFRFGLIGLGEVRLALGDLEAGADLPPLQVRLETLAATAHVALGHQKEALESLLRALEADPSLALDPLATSPKVLLALRLARATRGGTAEAE